METGIVEHWREWARGLEQEARAVYLASKDPRVPWYAKLLAACVVGYLFSPIDLIPDFIPVLGFLDDLIIVPAGLLLVIKLIPPAVMKEHREAAGTVILRQKPNRLGALLVVAIWAALLLLSVLLIYLHTR